MISADPIYDLAGRKLLQGEFLKGIKQTISLADLKSGIYILKVDHESGSWTKKFSVKK